MPRLFTCVVLLVYSLSASAALAQPQPAAPKPPDKFRALIRYRIIAPRDVHVAMYDALIDDLDLYVAFFLFRPQADSATVRILERIVQQQTEDLIHGRLINLGDDSGLNIGDNLVCR